MHVTQTGNPVDPFVWGTQTYVMGILNVTHDSFSGDGLLQAGNGVGRAVEQAVRFAAQGAHLLDIGGESTRPGATPVPLEEELHRVLPMVRAVAAATDIPLSIDTWKSEVAAAALEAGACMVNDVWGLRRDPKMGGVVAVHRAWIVLMHQRAGGVPQGDEHLGFRYVDAQHTQVLEEVESDLRTSIALAHAAGVHDDRILLDPGIGFGKTVEQNLLLVNCLDRIKAMGYPVLLGVSRKSFLGYTLGCTPQERLEGTSAAVSIGIARGADMVRVHDVEAMSRVVRMSDALVRQTERLPFG